jgi:hypothetical protein
MPANSTIFTPHSGPDDGSPDGLNGLLTSAVLRPSSEWIIQLD